MKVENPVAFSFIMQDDLYLLNAEKMAHSVPVIVEPLVETPVVKFNYLGGHKKNFLVIVHYPDKEHIEEKHLTALQSIFSRLGLELDDVAIFNRAHNDNATFEHITTFFNPKKLLLLGADSLPKGLDNALLNKPTQNGAYHMLYSFSFAEMMDNTENKKAFWEQMKLL